MAYKKHTELQFFKDRAGLTYRDFSEPMRGLAPSTIAAKFNGFITLTGAEEKIIKRICFDRIQALGKATNKLKNQKGA